jgi:hypothetical protein
VRPVFGHREHHVARAVLRDAHDRRAGCTTWPGSASMAVMTPATSATRSCSGLVALGASCACACSSCACAAFSVVSRRSSSAPLMKFCSRSSRVALEVGGSKVAVGQRGGLLGARGVGGQR